MKQWKYVTTYLIIIILSVLALATPYLLKGKEHIVYTETLENEVVLPQIPPILEKIATCESGNRQFNASGTVLRGKINPHDIGKFQINELYHASSAENLGLDIYTEAGNTLFALYLYETQGTKPWLYSSACWSAGLDSVGTSSIMNR